MIILLIFKSHPIIFSSKTITFLIACVKSLDSGHMIMLFILELGPNSVFKFNLTSNDKLDYTNIFFVDKLLIYINLGS